MSDLSSLQRALAAVLRAPASSDAVALADHIAAGNERLSPAMQLDIYREQFVLRHLDVLREDFLALEHLLGEDGFERLALAYLAQFPPSSFTLRDLGRDLPRFVAESAPWSTDTLVADVARVEQAFVEAFDGADAPLLELAAVAAVPEDAWPSAHIVLQPSLERLVLAHPAHDYRLSARSETGAALRPEARVCHVVVFRGPERLQCLDIDADAYALLDELARGTLLGEACERVAASSGASDAAFAEKVGAWFQEWTALRWISRVEGG